MKAELLKKNRTNRPGF